MREREKAGSQREEKRAERGGEEEGGKEKGERGGEWGGGWVQVQIRLSFSSRENKRDLLSGFYGNISLL